MSKKLILIPALFFAAFMSSTLTSCGDKCKDVECNTGTCLDGTCECGDGFEGTNCEIEWSAKFLGSYLGTDIVTGGTANGEGTYTLNSPAVITRVSETEVSISNFGGFNSFVKATVSRPGSGEATTLTLNFTDPAGRKFTGTATLSGTTLSGDYVVTYTDNTTDIANFTYTKQ